MVTGNKKDVGCVSWKDIENLSWIVQRQILNYVVDDMAVLHHLLTKYPDKIGLVTDVSITSLEVYDLFQKVIKKKAICQLELLMIFFLSPYRFDAIILTSCYSIASAVN